MSPGADKRNLLRLLQITDTSFPIGSFAYSNGLEALYRTGAAPDEASLSQLLAALVRHCLVTRDCWFVRSAVRAVETDGDLAACASLELAACTSEMEARAVVEIGAAMLRVAEEAFKDQGLAPALARVAQDVGGKTARATVYGATAASLGIDKKDAIGAYVFSALSMMCSAAVRLGIATPNGAQRALAQVVESTAPYRVPRLPYAVAPLIDIGLARHERLPGRMFRN